MQRFPSSSRVDGKRQLCARQALPVLFQDRPVRRKPLKQIRQYVRRCKWIWLYKEERVVTLGAITEDEQFELGP